jgi:SAM-dependent methyltransferase
MTTEQIQFNDGAAYERYMGVWSQLAGDAFLEWLAPKSEQQWLDIGCGNGAFTQMIFDRCAPSRLLGIDPSEAQLAYARTRLNAAQFEQGDAMSLPYANNSVDIAVMPLVIFFVPEPAKGVAEMVRVVRSGGLVTAYAWDLLGGGFPYEAVRVVLKNSNINAPLPPSPNAGNLSVLHDLWVQAGLQGVETKEIVVERVFASFDEYWSIVLDAPSLGAQLMAIDAEQLEVFKAAVRARLTIDATGKVICSGRANAVRGVVG